jgi:pyruvate formate lyase activating enzyme
MFHFLPGTGILSIATVGCNLHCKFCQNWEISQANPEDVAGGLGAGELPPEQIPELAKQQGCRSVAYTYSEPLVFYEYTLDGCRQSAGTGLRSVLVTAGYINEAPLRRLCQYVHGANIDLKAFSDRFYRDVCRATLKPVLNTLIVSKSLGVLVEITNLVIPTLNDSDEDLRKLSRWVAQNLGKETPLHFSRFWPMYQMANLPPTPGATLDRAKQIAESEGLYYVYVGNVTRPGAEDTRCHACGKLLVARRGYTILENNIAASRCPDCKTEVYGIWQ